VRNLEFPPSGFLTLPPGHAAQVGVPGVAHFPRLHEYAGVWLVEPGAFALHWVTFHRLDYAAHVANVAAAVNQPADRSTLTEMRPGKGGKSVALIRAEGLLMKQRSSMGGTSTVQLRREIRAAANDPNVSGILLAVESPGGSAAGMLDLAAEVRSARRAKPVWAQIEDLGASAAYWLASQADMVFANSPMSLVGSIGTYQVVYDYSAAAEKDGVKVFLFATGPLKGAATPGTPVTPEQQADFQSRVDDVQTHFDAAVRNGRSMNAGQLAAVRSGGVFSAAKAIDLKLIDKIQSPERTLEALANAK
jgi:signal peptide peptidase SppA